jgi:hypothetical protein
VPPERTFHAKESATSASSGFALDITRLRRLDADSGGMLGKAPDRLDKVDKDLCR